jgi:hypothetical protein
MDQLGEQSSSADVSSPLSASENSAQVDELGNKLASMTAAEKDRTKWLFVIGIEQYAFTDNIAYAKNSAQLFAKTVQKRFGVPEENTYMLLDSDATGTRVKTNLTKMLRRVKILGTRSISTITVTGFLCPQKVMSHIF